MQTLASYTRDNAWVEFRDDRKGQLTPGMLADIVVLSHDITELEPAQITDASARLTICNGRITYAAE
jgi:predicted amidohydrolase YtcJ